MQYRTNKNNGKLTSLLGMGTMRLPILDDGSIDERKSISLIRTAIDKGVNYIDTAWMYHDGKSEGVTGKALRDGYREKVFLADKMPVWLVKDEKAQTELFEEQLLRCDTDYFDMYLIHNVCEPVWKRCEEFHTFEFLENMKAKGKIKQLGFSFHSKYDFFKEVVDAHNWDFCQIQLNYMDAQFQAGVNGLKYAGENNLPVIIMEPLKGGRLTDKLPSQIKKFWQQADVKRTPAEWAFRWIADFPEVITILSGMNSIEQLEENVRIMDKATPNSLNEKEHRLIKQVADKYNEMIQYSCTGCKYCMPCPIKIDIPTVISLYNEWFLYDSNPKTKADFNMFMSKGTYPSQCKECGICEEHCPQNLPIREVMKKASQIFEK